MKRIAIWAAMSMAAITAPAWSAEPTVADLGARMEQYEVQIQQLDQRIQQAEQRANQAEAELARVAAAPAPSTAVAAGPPQIETNPPAPRHYADRASTPHGEGSFTNAWNIPGTDSYVAIGGYVKVDFIYDFDYVGNDDEFKTNTIAIDGTPEADLGGQSTLNAKETRLNVDFRKPTGLGVMRGFIEGDFYGSGGTLRLRHAYGQLGGFLIGQTWSTFTDMAAHPETLDIEGPDSFIMRRTPLIRYTGKLADNWSWGAALEDPTTSIQNNTGLAGSVRSEYPDLLPFIRYQSNSGSLQLAGVVRQLRFDGESGVPDATDTGYGVALSFSRQVLEHTVLSGQFTYGDGVANYIQGLGGQSLDAVLTADGGLDPVAVSAGMLALSHHWSPTWRSTVTYSISDVDSDPGLSDSAIKRLQDAHLNLIWSPFKSVALGGEVMWGERKNQDGSKGDATRLQFSVKYTFD